MNERKKVYEASASSLIDLKAELYRKQEAFKQLKLNRALGKPIDKTVNKKADKWLNKNTGVAERNAKDITLEIDKDPSIQKARAALERKAKLYEFLSKGNTVEGNEDGQLFLVNFEKKSLDLELKGESEKNDLPPSATNINENQNSESIYGVYNQETYDIPSEAEKTIPSPEPEGPVHYQNVQYSEIRQHGTGYYAFSQDEEERKKQMENLQRMREQTIKQTKEREKLKEKRKAMLKARLVKVRQRKNIPAKEDDTDSDSDEDDRDKLEAENVTNDEQNNLKDIPLPDTNPSPINDDASKNPRVRPWDIGKDMDPVNRPIAPKFKKMSQEAWIEERREERCNEFAPPDLYRDQRHSRPKWKKNRQRKDGKNFTPYLDKQQMESEMHDDRTLFWEDRTPTPPVDSIAEALAYFRKQSDAS